MANYNCYALDENGRPLFDENGKVDLKRGDIYISVSTILAVENPGDFLAKWMLDTFGNEPEPYYAYQEYMTKVSSLGSKIHRFVELDLKGQTKEANEMVDDSMLAGVDSWLRFKKAHTIELIESEKILFSKKLRIAGQMDMKLKIDGVTYLADLKTGSCSDKNFVQIAAYKYLDKEMGADNSDVKLLILGGKDSKSKISEGGSICMHEPSTWFGKANMTEEDLFAWFCSLREVWRLKNLTSRKFNPVIKNLSEAIDPMVKRFHQAFRAPI